MLSVDEKSQIQALDRTRPGLPIKKGRAGTMTHDYKRHGTTYPRDANDESDTRRQTTRASLRASTACAGLAF